jgi:hypothetical protein
MAETLFQWPAGVFGNDTRTTGNVRNAGYYVALAKELVEETRQETRQRLLTDVPGADATPPGRCANCKFGRLPDGGYCTCATGRDLERVEQSKKTKRQTGNRPEGRSMRRQWKRIEHGLHSQTA